MLVGPKKSKTPGNRDKRKETKDLVNIGLATPDGESPCCHAVFRKLLAFLALLQFTADSGPDLKMP